MHPASSLYVSVFAAHTCDARLTFPLVQILQAEPFEASRHESGASHVPIITCLCSEESEGEPFSGPDRSHAKETGTDRGRVAMKHHT